MRSLSSLLATRPNLLATRSASLALAFSDDELAVGGGLGYVDLASNLALQSMYVGVGALGVSFLLAPFHGPTVSNLILQQPRPAELLLGVGVAALTLAQCGLFDDAVWDTTSNATLDYSPAQVEQMRPLYQICGCETALPAAVAAIVVWQIFIALAEELYYRGFVQSAIRMLSSAILPGGTADVGALGMVAQIVGESVALAGAAVLFGLVHTEFVGDAERNARATTAARAGAANCDAQQSAGEGVADDRNTWFRVTATYGALYGLLFATCDHRLAAPILAHGLYNSGLCVRDWQRMRRTPAVELDELFAQDGSSLA